jgi:hypothetical protein
MLVSKLYAATMATGAPEPAGAGAPAGEVPDPRGRRRPPPAPPRPRRATVPRLRVHRGPRGTTRLSVVS